MLVFMWQYLQTHFLIVTKKYLGVQILNDLPSNILNTKLRLNDPCCLVPQLFFCSVSLPEFQFFLVRRDIHVQINLSNYNAYQMFMQFWKSLLQKALEHRTMSLYSTRLEKRAWTIDTERAQLLVLLLGHSQLIPGMVDRLMSQKKLQWKKKFQKIGKYFNLHIIGSIRPTEKYNCLK